MHNIFIYCQTRPQHVLVDCWKPVAHVSNVCLRLPTVAVFIAEKSLYELLCFYFPSLMHHNTITAVTNKTAAYLFGRPRQSDSTLTTLCHCALLQLAFKSTTSTNRLMSPPHVAPEPLQTTITHKLLHPPAEAARLNAIVRRVHFSALLWLISCLPEALERPQICCRF